MTVNKIKRLSKTQPIKILTDERPELSPTQLNLVI